MNDDDDDDDEVTEAVSRTWNDDPDLRRVVDWFEQVLVLGGRVVMDDHVDGQRRIAVTVRTVGRTCERAKLGHVLSTTITFTPQQTLLKRCRNTTLFTRCRNPSLKGRSHGMRSGAVRTGP